MLKQSASQKTVWFVSLSGFLVNKTNQMNQINQINKQTINQMDPTSFSLSRLQPSEVSRTNFFRSLLAKPPNQNVQ
jgi:hypothetical protein